MTGKVKAFSYGMKSNLWPAYKAEEVTHDQAPRKFQV